MASNLDLVRSIFAAWEGGDFSSAEWADPKIEYMIVGGPDPISRTGMDGMAEGFRDWVSAWEDLHIAADEYRELDSGRVLVLLRYIGRGKTSGVDLGGMEATGAGAFHVHGDQVTSLAMYWDRDRALADLGLPPEGDADAD